MRTQSSSRLDDDDADDVDDANGGSSDDEDERPNECVSEDWRRDECGPPLLPSTSARTADERLRVARQLFLRDSSATLATASVRVVAVALFNRVACRLTRLLSARSLAAVAVVVAVELASPRAGE